jgi:hypothetical protein
MADSGLTTDRIDLEISESAQYPLKPSFDDARGIQRVAGPAIQQWKPAQVDPTDEEIAHYEAFLERDTKQRDLSLGLNHLPAPDSNEPPYSALDQVEGGAPTDIMPSETAPDTEATPA